MNITFHTVQEVANLLCVDDGKILGWIHSGQLIGINIAHDVGGRPRWRVSQAALDGFLLRRQSQPPAPARRKRTELPPVKQYV